MLFQVLGLLLFILYIHDMWLGLENMPVSTADDTTPIAHNPSPNVRSDVTESLNRDLSKISTWCNLWGMQLNPTIVSRSRTVFPTHPELFYKQYFFKFMSLKILGVTFVSKFTFERHIRSIYSSVAHKIGLLGKLLKVFGDQCLIEIFSIHLSFLVWSIAPLFCPLQRIPILNFLIRIFEFVNF